MSLKISKEGSFFIVNLEFGAKLIDLHLTTKEGKILQVVNGQQMDQQSFCSDGNYLLYPWVNRLSSEIV